MPQMHTMPQMNTMPQMHFLVTKKLAECSNKSFVAFRTLCAYGVLCGALCDVILCLLKNELHPYHNFSEAPMAFVE